MTIEEQITIFEHNAEHERKEGDLNNYLHFHQLSEWLKELKAHREAWEKIKSELWMEGMNMTGEYQGVWIRYRDIERVIDANRPKEGENE